ncbi:MAG: extracellular solute-binding protein, partial [Chloroflexota bacterium]
PASITIPTQRAPGFLEPIRPLLFRPDVLDEKAWLDGIQWLDNDKKWSFMFQSVVNLLLINSDLVKDGEIKTAADLLDPKWKGKITASDPRMSTFWGEATAMRTAMGDAVFADAMKRLIKDQDVAFHAQARQRAEGMIRGQYALGWGVPRIDLKEFTDAGLGKNLKYIQVQGFSYVPCTGIWFYNRAPHPSAAKLFANWILTKAGQQAWSTNAQTNVRRLDVPPFDPERLPPPGNKYIFLGDETSITSTDQTQKIINQVLQS